MPSQENGYQASSGYALENCELQTRNKPRSRVIAVIEEFSLTWFTVSMNTGILSILMHENPYQFHGLYVLSTIMFIFNIVLFFAFFLILMLRIILRPRRFIETLMGDLQELAMLGTIPIAWFTIAGQVGITVSNAAWGSHAFTIVAYVMWWIGTAVMLFIGVMVFAVLLKHSVTDTANISPALVIPFVGTATNGVIGALIVTYSAEVSAGIAIPVIVVSYLILGIGFFMGIIVLTVFCIRAIEHGIPDGMTPALFMLIGAPGQSGAAMLLLGEASRMHFPGYMKGTALTEMSGSAFSSIGVLFGLVFVGLGVYFMMCAAYVVLETAWRKAHQYSLLWWATIFPVATINTAWISLASSMDSTTFKVLSSIFLIALLLLYFVNWGFTLWFVFTGRTALLQQPTRSSDTPEREKSN